MPIPKKGTAEECSNYHTITLISHSSKVMLKIFQARLQQYVNCEPPGFKMDLEKTEESEIKLPTSVGSLRKQESSRKSIYFCFIDYAKAFNCVDHNKLWKIVTEIRIPDYHTCLLRNLYTGQETTVGTRHGTKDWFKIGEGLPQGCILSPAYLTYGFPWWPSW